MFEETVEINNIEFTDENGKWMVGDGVKMLIEPSQEWIDKHRTKSTEQIQQEKKQNIQDQLETLDIDLNRGTEDLIDLLISKGVINEIDLPPNLKDRKALKQSLRQQLKDL